MESSDRRIKKSGKTTSNPAYERGFGKEISVKEISEKGFQKEISKNEFLKKDFELLYLPYIGLSSFNWRKL
jgi:hypothetical protein